MISVIVPHLNDPGLEACLRSLVTAQDYDGAWEVLVVDNGSVHPPEALCSRFDRVTLLHEPEPGPGPARNTGVAAAKGDILAFTDADCVVASDWLVQIDRAFQDKRMQVIGGDITVPFRDPSDPTAIEAYERVYSFRNKKHIEDGYSAAANLAVKTAVFERVGGFGGRNSAEDQIWGQRASTMGYPPCYIPKMCVHTPARATWTKLQDKWGRHIAHHFNASGGGTKWIVYAFAVLISPAFEIAHIARTDLLSGPRQRLLCLMGLVRIRGYRAIRMLSPNRTKLRWNDESAME